MQQHSFMIPLVPVMGEIWVLWKTGEHILIGLLIEWDK